MAKALRNDIVEIDGVKTVAERTVDARYGQVAYKPYGNYHKGLDVNQVVYDLMTIAAQDALECGMVVFGGDYTAAEMAGTLCGLHQYMEGDSYRTIRIETTTFSCTYETRDAFYQMADWESVMNLAPKNYRRFHCEGKEVPKGTKVKAYTRWHGYKPTTVSLAAENARIAKKFEVIGAMAKSLTSEGMRRALSVLKAVESIKKMHGYDMADIADRLLRRKLWREFGRDKSQQPMCYTARDFEHGPEVWKQVDEAYVKELTAYFRQVLAESPAPAWPKKDDVVMLKDRERMAKKYQGKFLCEGISASLSCNADRIEWRASVRVKKYDCEYFLPGQLEPVPDESKKKGAKMDAKMDANKGAAVVQQQTEQELSPAERLRAVLLEQMRKAA